MHDIRAIREEPQAYIEGWERRGVTDARAQVEHLLTLDAGLRQAQTAFQGAQSRRNELSKLIGAAKAKRDEATAALLMQDVETLKGDIETANRLEGDYGRQLKDQLAKLPNLAASGVPHGADEHGNLEVSAWGDLATLPSSHLNQPLDHTTLGERMGLMDFERAARMSGSRFVALKGGLARMERALGQFMLDLQTREHGYTEVSPPIFVRQEAMFGTGQLPKFYDDAFLVMDPATRMDLLSTALEDIEVAGVGTLAARCGPRSTTRPCRSSSSPFPRPRCRSPTSCGRRSPPPSSFPSA